MLTQLLLSLKWHRPEEPLEIRKRLEWGYSQFHYHWRTGARSNGWNCFSSSANGRYLLPHAILSGAIWISQEAVIKWPDLALQEHLEYIYGIALHGYRHCEPISILSPINTPQNGTVGIFTYTSTNQRCSDLLLNGNWWTNWALPDHISYRYRIALHSYQHNINIYSLYAVLRGLSPINAPQNSRYLPPYTILISAVQIFH